MRAAHDYGKARSGFPQLVQDIETTQLRHLQIEHKNIRRQLSHCLKAFHTIARHTNQLHSWQVTAIALFMSKKQGSHDATHNSGIVRSENAQWPLSPNFH
jgi:hypothetical protein